MFTEMAFKRENQEARLPAQNRIVVVGRYLAGRLERRPCLWVYTGFVHSSKPGFGAFSMSSPVREFPVLVTSVISGLFYNGCFLQVDLTEAPV